MSTPRRNLFGDQRAKTAVLTRGTDDASRRALSNWLFGSKAKYSLRVDVAPFRVAPQAVNLVYRRQPPSRWGYRGGLGDNARFSNSLLQRGARVPTSLPAKQWAFGRLAAYVLTVDTAAFTLGTPDVGLAVGRVLPVGTAAYTLTGQAVGLLAGRVLPVGTAAFTITTPDVGLDFQGASQPPPPPPPVETPAGGGGWATLTPSHPITPRFWTHGRAHGKAKVTAYATAIKVEEPWLEPTVVQRELAGQVGGRAFASGRVIGLAHLRGVSVGEGVAFGRVAANRSAADEAAIAAILMAA